MVGSTKHFDNKSTIWWSG